MAVNSTVGDANADSYVDATYVDAYHLAQGNAEWAAGDLTKRDEALRRATTWLDGQYRKYFTGEKANGRAQSLEWPRKYATDADGYDIGSDEIPREIKDSQCEAALRELTTPNSLSPDVTAGGTVKREKVGPLEVEYTSGGSVNDSKPVLTLVDAILGSLLNIQRGSGTVLVKRA